MNNTWWLNSSDLDDEQRKIIDLPLEGDCLIVGPPGSGKTNLLLLRASFLSKSGRNNYSIITFTRSLKEFLLSGTKNYSVPEENTQTYFGWAKQIIFEHGIQIPADADFDETRINVLNGLKKIRDKLDSSSITDFLLIDEAQDYSAEEIDVIKYFATNIYAVGDSKQRIHVLEDTIEKISDSFTHVCKLEYHYRNGIEICRLADGILNQLNCDGSMESTCHYDEDGMKSSVKRFSSIDIHDQVQKMLELISGQLVAYPGEPIGIIVPRNVELKIVVKELRSHVVDDNCTYLSDLGSTKIDSNKLITVGTVHSTKGMEFRVCHFLAADTVKKFRAQKKMAFTACTRAKTSLVVYHFENLPSYFENALTNLEPRPAKPSLDDLFN